MGFKPLEQLFGKRPVVPNLPTVDISAEQSKALKDAQALLPEGEAYAGDINSFNQEQLLKALEFAFPGARAQVQKNIGSQLKGEISPEDSSQIWRNATAGGFARGFGGSQIGRNLGLRDLGISTLSRQQQGFQNYLNFANLGVPKQQFDVSSMFFTPQQRVQTQIYQNEQQFNRNWLAEQVRAAPSPMGIFTQNVITSLAGSAGKAIGAAA